MRHCTEVILLKKFCIYRENIFLWNTLAAINCKVGGDCARFDWKKVQVFESHWTCLFHRLFIHKCISMKKHSVLLVSKPVEKKNIYQQHHTEFTAIGIGRKTRFTKSVLAGELTFTTLGEFFRGATGSVSVFCQLYEMNNFHSVGVLGHICTLNKQITHRLYSIFYKYHQNQLKISKWRLIKKMLQVQWSLWSTCSGHMFPNNTNKNKTNCGLNILPIFWYKLIWILFVFMKELMPFQ